MKLKSFQMIELLNQEIISRKNNIIDDETFFNIKEVENVEEEFNKIEKEFSIDFAKKEKFKRGELEKLKNIYKEFLLSSKNDFTPQSYYLLAKNIFRMDIFEDKISKKNISPVEYNPSFFNQFSVIEKTISLFSNFFKSLNKDDDKIFFNSQVKRICNGLIFSYLENYKKASSRYKKRLCDFLIHFTKNKNFKIFFIDQLFAINILKRFLIGKDEMSFKEILENWSFPGYFFDTVLVQDLWFTWITNLLDYYNKKSVSKYDFYDKKMFNSVTSEKKKIITNYFTRNLQTDVIKFFEDENENKKI